MQRKININDVKDIFKNPVPIKKESYTYLILPEINNDKETRKSSICLYEIYSESKGLPNIEKAEYCLSINCQNWETAINEMIHILMKYDNLDSDYSNQCKLAFEKFIK